MMMLEKQFFTPMSTPVSMVLDHLLWKMEERSSGRSLVANDAVGTQYKEDREKL